LINVKSEIVNCYYSAKYETSELKLSAIFVLKIKSLLMAAFHLNLVLEYSVLIFYVFHTREVIIKKTNRKYGFCPNLSGLTSLKFKDYNRGTGYYLEFTYFTKIRSIQV